MATPAIRPLTNSQWKVSFSIAGGDFYFTTFSGIKDNAQTSTYADGVSSIIYNLRGPRQLQSMTVSTPFDPDVHSPLISWWKEYDCQPITIQVQPVDCNSQSIGSAITILDAQVTQINFANVDRSSSNVSMLELGFVANEFTYN
jgi:hypothetical protein